MKKIRILLSIALSVTLLFQSIYVSAASNGSVTFCLNDNETTEASPVMDASADEESVKDAEVLFELTDNRSAYTKEFLLSNGLHMAVAYPDQVHYEKDGKWKDIDNTLKLVDGKYTNAEGLFKANLPSKLTDNETISIETDGQTVSFRLLSASKGDRSSEPISSADAKVIEKTRNDSDGKLHPERVPEALTSRLSYEKILSGTDLVYDLTPGGIKESLIIETLEDSSETYAFELNTGDLIPKLSEDGSIELYEKGSDSPVFILPAPYLVDSENNCCHEVKLTLTGESGTYQLAYTLPIDWLSSGDRVWPVALDPAVMTAQVRSNIHDKTVYSVVDQNAPGIIEVARLFEPNNHYGIARSFVRFVNLPAITSSDVVVRADLSLYYATSQQNYVGDGTGNTAHFIEVHKVNSAWDHSTINWSNQPSIDWTVTETTNYHEHWFYDLEITDIVRDWYAGTNTGLALTLPQSVENDSSITNYRLQFWSADFSIWQTVEKPTAVIYFRNNNGLEGYWDYSVQDAGRAGTGYVNNFTGNLAFVHDDLGFSGNRMPVAVSHVYNLNDVTVPNDLNNSNDSGGNTFHMGYGWRTNFNQILYQWTVTDPNTTVPGTYYIWEDADGTDHYFKADNNGILKDEDGLDLTLTTNGTGTERYCITDKKGNKTYFDTLGRLTKLSNNQATVSSVTVTYSGNTKEIDTVTDGAGRRYVFTYSNNYLSRISYYGTGTTVLTYVDYQYTNGNLTSITDKDGKTAYYTYDSNRLLTSAKDVDGYKLSYTYNTVSAAYQPYRVLSVEETDESGATPVPGGKEEFSYHHNETVITDHNNNKVFLQFNDFGNLICTKDDEGNALFMQYAFNTDAEKDSNTNATKKGNQLRAESDLQYTVTNHMKGHSMENGLSYWSSENGATVIRQNTYTYADDYGLQVRNNSTYGGIRSAAYTVPAGKTYTFSCYVRPGNNKVYLKAVSGNTVYTSEKTPTGTTWRRLQVSFPNETNASQSVQFYVVTEGTDNFFVDAAQLEDSLTANKYNLIEDGDFRYGLSFAGTGGIHTAVTSSAAPQLNTNVLKITGDPLSTREYSQTISVSGSTGDYFTVAGWAKADSAPIYDNRSFSIEGRFLYSNNTWSSPFIASFNPDSNEWQFTATGMIAEQAYSAVKVTLTYNYNVNTACFDGIQLFRDGFGYKYEYDNDNHVISILSSSKEKDQYEYQNNDLTREILHTGSELTYTYDNYHNVLTATSSEGQVYHFTYDTYGNNTAVSITAGNETMSSSATYTSDGNRMATTTDAKGNVTTYQYNADTNLLEWVQYPNDTDGTNGTEDTRTFYDYDTMYRLASSSLVTDLGQSMSVDYTYDGQDRLTGVSSPTTDYDFTYGVFSLRTSVGIGNRTLSTYSYSNDRNHYLTGMAYGNGDSVTYTRDQKGRVTTETFEDNETVQYVYDNDGSLAATIDSESGTTTTQGYDYIGRLNTFEKTNDDIGMSLTYEYEGNTSRLTKVRDVYNGHARGITYTYDSEKRLTAFSHARGFRYYTYDDFERLSSYETKFKRASDGQWFTALTTTLNYLSPSSGTTTNQVASIRQQGSSFDDTFTYTYDGNGNVLSVSDGTYTTTYVYDSANELIRENNQGKNYTHTWTYDNAGNILTRKEYAYNTGDLANVTPTDTVNYVYGDSDWGDLLTSYDGNTIIYDAIGNPLSDGTWTYTWQHGRELKSMTDGTTTWDFTYDESGYRTKRTNGSKTYDYAYADGLLRYMEIDGTPYYITYAPDGTPMGIVEDDLPYYFETNLQGDVIGIVTYGGYRVVQYSYDAWGNLLSCTGARANTIGKANPIRYRGYVYDEETGFYYLGSRYYNPEMGRFINADVIVGQSGSMVGLNQFVYTFNNPIMLIDPAGEWPSWSSIFGVIAVVAAVVAVAALTVVTYGAAAPALAAVGGAVISSVSAGTIAAATSVAIGATTVAAAAGTASVIAGEIERTSSFSKSRSKNSQDLGSKENNSKKGSSSGKANGKIKSENKAPKNNQAQNRQTRAAAKKYGLNRHQEDELHRAVSGQGYSYQEILREAEYIKYGK